MAKKPTYEELEQQVNELEQQLVECKRAEQALLDSERTYRYLAENVDVGITMIDANHNILWTNRTVGKWFDKDPSEFVGMKCYKEFEKREQVCVNCPGVKAMATGRPHEIESQGVKDDGTSFTVRDKAFPLYDTDGKIIGFHEIVEDISDRKQVEEALRESKSHLAELLEASPAVIYRCEPSGQFPATFISSNIFDQMGYNPKDFTDNPNFWADHIHPEDKQRVFDDLENLFVEDSHTHEYRFSLSDGTYRWVLDKLRLIRNAEGSPIDIIGNWIDITERKRAEEEKKKLEAQLQHAQKMEAIGTLTSGVAHNFRNLLTPISLYSQLIQMTYKDDPQLQVMAEKTMQCVIRGAQLVDGLMQFSRKHAKELETINLAEVLRETYGLITKSFDKKIDIRMDIADSLRIRGDRSELSQVFMNLCTNARDAMPDGGELSIEARMEGDDALITISDTGLGMDEQTREQCFDPFFTTKEVDKGTGLGLSTTYGIVKDHGGEVHVFSELNKGTTFKLYFPLALSDEHQKQAGVHDIVQGSGEKVLIVDDEVDILEVLVMLAEQLGYSAASADSGKAGIDKYKSWRPDVVLLDRNMPGMDGLRCARSILEYDPEARIVLISGYDAGGPSGIDDKTKALIKWYLTKPINMEELSQTIRKVLDKD